MADIPLAFMVQLVGQGKNEIPNWLALALANFSLCLSSAPMVQHYCLGLSCTGSYEPEISYNRVIVHGNNFGP